MPKVQIRQQQRTGLAKVFAKRQKPQFEDLEFQNNGIIEACYHRDTAAELVNLCAQIREEENIKFVIACNHFLLRASCLVSRLAPVIGLRQGTIQQQIDQIFDEYIDNNSLVGIDLSFHQRLDLLNKRVAITDMVNIRAFVPSRNSLVNSIKNDALNDAVTKKGAMLSEKLISTLASDEQATDGDVMWRLNLLHANTQAPPTLKRAVAAV